MRLLGLFRLGGGLHSGEQDFLARTLAKRLFLGPMGIMLKMFWCFLAHVGCSCGFVIHMRDLLLVPPLTRGLG